MTKSQALFEFFNSFGLTAYPSTAVPDDAIFPWLTYENNVGNALDGQISCAVNLWYHTDSEADPNAKAEEIAQRIGRGGTQIKYDGGSIWIKRGQPWSLALSDQADSAIKRRSINVILEFL